MPIQITREEYERKFGKQPVLLQTSVKSAPIKITKTQYEAKFGTQITSPKYQKYDVPLTPEQKTQNLSNAKAQAEKLKKESDEANKFTGQNGILGNTVTGVGETLASSQIGLGKTIAKTFGNQSDVYAKNLSSLRQTQANLYKMISEKQKKGEDASNLKRAYNQTLDQISENTKALGEETNLPSTGEALGQLGGTALDLLTAGTYGKAKTALMQTGKLSKTTNRVITHTGLLNKSGVTKKIATAVGLPELGKISEQKATGLFTKQGIKNVGKGAAVGYGYDVTQGAQGARGEDRTGAKAFIPGVGTVIGATIPLVTETTQSFKNKFNPEIQKENLIAKRKMELDKLDRLQTLKKTTEKGRARGIDVKNVLAETDVLHGSVDKTGKITTKGPGGAVEQYTDDFIRGNEAIVSDALKKEGRSVAPQMVKQRLTQAVMDAGIEGKALTNALKAIDDEVAGYAIREGANGTIPLETLHSAKVDKYNGINFFTEGNTKKYDKTIARALKEIIEKETKSVDVQNINKELSKHFAVIDYLEKLDGKIVEGGKLGKYFAQTIGAIVGSHFGPLGAIVGAEAGGRVKGNLMSRVFSGKTGKMFPQAKVIEDAVKFKESKPLELPQSSSEKSLGSLNTSQSTTISPTKNGIDSTIPETQGKSIDVSRETSKITQKIKGWIKEFIPTKSKLPPSRSKESVVLTNLDDVSDKVKSLNLPLKEIKTNREFIKHLVDSRQEELMRGGFSKDEIQERLDYLADNFIDTIKNPTKIADNSTKRMGSYRFAKLDNFKDRRIGVVVDVTPKAGQENIATVHFISEKDFNALKDIAK